MGSFLTFLLLICMVLPASLANIFAYPLNKKWSIKISDYIVKVLAPRLFAIVHCYRGFHFWGYKESKKQLPEQFIIISNHQSLLDIPVFMKFMPEKEVRFVAKSVLGRHIPLVSEMLRSQEHCMISRKAKPMEAMSCIDEFGKRVVKNNQIPILFPEGTRTKDGKVGKFYTAGFRKLTESTNLPVAICALDGGFKLRDLTSVTTNLKRGCYRVKVLKVCDCPKTKEECNALLEEAKKLIQQQLDEWSCLPSSQY
ncbi:MAG: 1-acyl-sn-glycerol-3-phosphate acyltransferase [Treponema sp.]|nr:1-acyl-sn-glycerol-3-phosphate acyltransferase [Treponema sp.]